MLFNQEELTPLLPQSVLLFIMLIMSLNLYLKLRNRLFIILSGSFFSALLAPIVVICLSFFIHPINPSHLSLLILMKVSYLLLLMGLHHLYKPKETNIFRNYFIGIVSVIIVSLLSLFISPIVISILIEIMILGLTGYCIYTASTLTDKKYIYITALLLYSATCILEIFYTLIYSNIVVFISLSFQFLFFLLIFVLFFERIVDILQAVSYKSITDGLTKLYNKSYFLDQVNKKMKNANPISVIFCDIDNFKQLNDTKGHEEGDKVLIQVGSIVREEVHKFGIAARYGGEEIVAILDDPTIDPIDIAEKIRKRVVTETIVTLSIGFSTKREDEDQDIIVEADMAMYKAKKSGKNKVIGFIPDLNIEE